MIIKMWSNSSERSFSDNFKFKYTVTTSSTFYSVHTVFIRIEAPPVLEGNKLNILSNLTFIDSSNLAHAGKIVVLDSMAHNLSPFHVENHYYCLQYIGSLIFLKTGTPLKFGLGTGCLNSNKYGKLFYSLCLKGYNLESIFHELYNYFPTTLRLYSKCHAYTS